MAFDAFIKDAGFVGLLFATNDLCTGSASSQAKLMLKNAFKC
jgi:hypothetical protein